MKRTIALLAAAAVATAISPAVAGTPEYTIVDIGLVSPSDIGSQGFGVSPGGVGVGRSLGTSNQAFSWTASGGRVALDVLPGRGFHVANGANDSGLVVGVAATTAFGSGALPTLWTNGASSQLALLAGETVGRANDINGTGTVIGSMDGGSTEFAAIWQAGVPAAITATAPGGIPATTMFRINDAGKAVGIGIDPGNLARNVGLLYDSVANTMIEIPPLAGDNGTIAFDISEANHVVGASTFNQSNALPFIWDNVNGTVEIPLPAGTSSASARGVNSDGLVVGIGSGVFAVPFLYENGTTHRLQDLIDPLSDWDLSMNTSSGALGISEDGIIIGTGVLDGIPHAFAMIPVGPDADFDGDGDVDLTDFAVFSLCFGGPNNPPAASCPDGGTDADFDDDGDVDLGDFAEFSLQFTGPL